ncbi:MAG: NAD(P)-binding domain-containing protein, partial [Firmicutes bacterium]|nr:NAD(P)-binding domain-containing protein [Bacillota bacterium]
AEWVILKVLEIYKQTQHFAAAQRRSEWNKNVDILELNGKTMGIIGTGSIGVEVAKRANAFGCKVIGLNTRGRNVAFFNTCWPRTQLHDFLPQCDIVVLTLPFTEQVKDLLNRGTLPLMKEGAVLINIARGGIINEADLLDILSSGSLRGVALDVFEEEPLPSDNPLWQHERVLVTPHISFASEQIAQRMHALVYANLKALQGLQEWENVVEICREIRE